jgi:4-hydroxy-tetrahydrodipicolinate synthase
MSKLSQKESWYGQWTALITPLKKENNSLCIDVESLEKLIQSQLSSQTLTGLVIAGSTGEGSLLSQRNYSSLLREAKRIVAGRVPLVAGVGIAGTEASLATAHVIREIGYDGLLVSPPAYIKTPQRGLLHHYRSLASVGLPICIYEVAGRAASSIQVETIAELLKSEPSLAKCFVAVKDASADIQRALLSVELLGEKMALLSGDDFTYQPFLCAGGNGIISVATHFIPKRMKRIHDCVKKGDLAGAAAEQNHCRPLIEALFWESNPIPVKSAAHALGLIQHNLFCEPLVPMDASKLEKLLALHKSLGELA